MVFALYFLKRFFKYLFIINGSFVLLFNLIEFFEKIIRIKNTPLTTISSFILLNILPSFFQTINLSCWLTTCLLLKEFIQQHEWEILKLLNINFKKLFNLFLLAGCLTSLITFVGKEFLTLNLYNKAETFKQEKLKRNHLQNITNKWIWLTNTAENKKTFCFFQNLDLTTNKGKNLAIIYLNSKFEIEKLINTSNFKISSEEKTIIIPNGTIISTDNTYKKIENKSFKEPSFFYQLQKEVQTISLFFLLKNIIQEKKILPSMIWNNLIAKIIKRFIFYLQIIIYPIFTFCLFCLFEYTIRLKWILIFIPYPIIILFDLFSNFITEKNYSSIFILLPYIILILAIFLCKILPYKKLEISS